MDLHQQLRDLAVFLAAGAVVVLVMQRFEPVSRKVLLRRVLLTLSLFAVLATFDHLRERAEEAGGLRAPYTANAPAIDERADRSPTSQAGLHGTLDAIARTPPSFVSPNDAAPG